MSNLVRVHLDDGVELDLGDKVDVEDMRVIRRLGAIRNALPPRMLTVVCRCISSFESDVFVAELLGHKAARCH